MFIKIYKVISDVFKINMGNPEKCINKYVI